MEPIVTVTGNVGKDPVVVKFPSGDSIVEFSLAVNSKAENGYKPKTSWYTVQVRNGLRAHVARIVRQGLPVTVTGYLSNYAWKTEEASGTTLRLAAQAVSVNVIGIESLTRVPKAESAPEAEAGEAAVSVTAITDDLPF